MEPAEGLTLPFTAKCLDGFFHYLTAGVIYEVEAITDLGDTRLYHIRNNEGHLNQYFKHRFEEPQNYDRVL